MVNLRYDIPENYDKSRKKSPQQVLGRPSVAHRDYIFTKFSGLQSPITYRNFCQI